MLINVISSRDINSIISFFLLYVDDLLVVGLNMCEIKNLNETIKRI